MTKKTDKKVKKTQKKVKKEIVEPDLNFDVETIQFDKENSQLVYHKLGYKPIYAKVLGWWSTQEQLESYMEGKKQADKCLKVGVILFLFASFFMVRGLGRNTE